MSGVLGLDLVKRIVTSWFKVVDVTRPLGA